MSRLGMLYAITDDEVELLKNKNENDMYGFMSAPSPQNPQDDTGIKPAAETILTTR